MKIGQQINFIVINKQANSLYSLIADGQYRTTPLGRNTWKTLIGSGASLQLNCNKEGFNAVSTVTANSKARIGLIGNNQNDCNTVPVIPESGLVQEENWMTPTPVEMRLQATQIMEKEKSKPWDIS